MIVFQRNIQAFEPGDHANGIIGCGTFIGDDSTINLYAAVEG
jgi:hypothetical protein